MSESSLTFVVAIIDSTVIGIGFIGNVISIIVFLRKTFRNNSVSTYCTALAISECLAIIQFINLIYYFPYNTYLMNLSDTFCKIVHTGIILINAIPPFIMVAFSVDKLLSMRTSSIAILKKKWFQWSVVAAIVLFHIGLYMYYPILVKRIEIFPGYFLCDGSTIGFYKVHQILNILETCIIPFVVLMITSILTIRLLFKSRNSIERNGKLAKERKLRDRKYAITSVTFNILFIVLKLPSAIFFILFAFYSYYDVYYYHIGNFLFFINSSSGFLVHLVTNSLFRRELLILFRLTKRTNESSANSSLTNRPIRMNQVTTI